MEYPKLPCNKGKVGYSKDPVTKEKRYYTIEDEIQKAQSTAKHKIIVLQKMRFHHNDEIQLRLGYYIIGKLPKMKGKWTWGQYATFLPMRDFKTIYASAVRKGWFE